MSEIIPLPLDRCLYNLKTKTLTTLLSKLEVEGIDLWKEYVQDNHDDDAGIKIKSHVTGKEFTFIYEGLFQVNNKDSYYFGYNYWRLISKELNCPVKFIYVINDYFCKIEMKEPLDSIPMEKNP